MATHNVRLRGRAGKGRLCSAPFFLSSKFRVGVDEFTYGVNAQGSLSFPYSLGKRSISSFTVMS